jgi:NAD(P)-dependent dehydrogenase (short-subunit alcohol dehydrogenase family)
VPVSVVIGGISGIGSVVAKHLANRGDKIYTVSRSNSTAKNHISCDISADCTPIIDCVTDIDYLIFTHRYRGTDWNETFDVTVKGVDNVIQAVSNKLNKDSSVVIISSNASHFVLEEQPAEYHSSRAALDGLMRYYAVVHGNKGTRFNSILPSTLIKPENVDFFSKDNEVRKMIEEITPLGRMGDAEDIANIVEFLCSSKSSFLTGNSFMVDGGLSLVGQESIARSLLGHKHKK